MEMTAEQTENKPRSPLRRRLLRAAVGVLGAELLVGGTLWGKDQFDRFFARPTTNQGEIPKPPAVEPDKPATEKEINKVPLAEITKKNGLMSIVPWGGQMNIDRPYGTTLMFQDLTIVAVDKTKNDNRGNSIWVALAMPGEKLMREDVNKKIVNFDKTITEEYVYRGLTAWIHLDDIVFVREGPGSEFTTGISNLEKKLIVGQSISFEVDINQPNKLYQSMNKASFDLLGSNLEKPNSDRSDQTFKFHATFAFLQPINPT